MHCKNLGVNMRFSYGPNAKATARIASLAVMGVIVASFGYTRAAATEPKLLSCANARWQQQSIAS